MYFLFKIKSHFRYQIITKILNLQICLKFIKQLRFTILQATTQQNTKQKINNKYNRNTPILVWHSQPVGLEHAPKARYQQSGLSSTMYS